MDSTADSFPLRGLVELVASGAGGGRWRVRDEGVWCSVTPDNYPLRAQGWKLHVSATPVSAPLVLHRCAEVLVRQECAFKFAADLTQVDQLTSKSASRPQAGKFLTAYPRDDDHFRTLAGLLDAATAGLPGPAILSDRPYRHGSLVHYRYGAFAGFAVLTNDGEYDVRVENPDGELVPDERQPWFCPPRWAELPFEGLPPRGADAARTAKPVLLADRFRVTEAIQKSARGGVYRAKDLHSGGDVVIKQARPHITGLTISGDARDGLRHEAEMLTRLGGIAAAPVLIFEANDNYFLAVEAVPGSPLAKWVRERLRQRTAGSDAVGLPAAEALTMAARLAELLDAVHATGLVYRDFTPNNVIVGDHGELRLVDAELAATPGEWVLRAQTPGFSAPEALGPRSVMEAPGPAADCYSLGAVLCYLATGVAPSFAADTEPTRSHQDRIRLLLDCQVGNPAAAALRPAILGLTEPDPARRWDVARLRSWLAAPATESEPAGAGRPGPADIERLLTDGLAHLVTHLNPTARDRLFPSSEFGSRTDAGNVQHGAAGVLAVLTRVYAAQGDPELRSRLAGVARWLDRLPSGSGRVLPGLYFGRSGTAWALHDAAGQLADVELAERALQLARALPVNWPNPDICHGMAGAGLATLHLWRSTGDPVLRERVTSYVAAVSEAAVYDGDRVCWPVPATFDSKLAGLNHYGFAHGIAGVGTFLLAAGLALGLDDSVKLARRAGETLLAGAVQEGDAAWWPDSVTGPTAADMRYHWCSGASGVGSFLIRLWQATGEPVLREFAHAAAVSVHRSRWFSGSAACHGLAGNGEFLLDMAAATDGPYREWAGDLAGCLYASHTLRDQRMVVPDERGAEVRLDFQTGLAGVVAFLWRLHHGGPRWWMVDEPTVMQA